MPIVSIRTGAFDFFVASNRTPVERIGTLTVRGQPFIVTQEPGVTSGALADIYIDEVDVTFPGGDGPLGAVTNEGVDGSLGIKYTGLAQPATASRRMAR
jgi:hypothetical protein